MGFSRQECWSGLLRRPPGGLPNPGMEPTSLCLPALPGGFFTTSATWEACVYMHVHANTCVCKHTYKLMPDTWALLSPDAVGFLLSLCFCPLVLSAYSTL